MEFYQILQHFTFRLYKTFETQEHRQQNVLNTISLQTAIYKEIRSINRIHRRSAVAERFPVSLRVPHIPYQQRNDQDCPGTRPLPSALLSEFSQCLKVIKLVLLTCSSFSTLVCSLPPGFQRILQHPVFKVSIDLSNFGHWQVAIG